MKQSKIMNGVLAWHIINSGRPSETRADHHKAVASLAKKMRISKSLLYKLLSGEKNITLRTAAKIEKVTGGVYTQQMVLFGS